MGEATTSQKLKVFVSYSRRDSTDFADELVTGFWSWRDLHHFSIVTTSPPEKLGRRVSVA